MEEILISSPPAFDAAATVVVNMETTVLTDVPCVVCEEPIPYRRAISAETRGREPMFCSDRCMHTRTTQLYRGADSIIAAFTTAQVDAGVAPSRAVLKVERLTAIELLKTHDVGDILAAIQSTSARLQGQFRSLTDVEKIGPRAVIRRKEKSRARSAS